MTDATLKLALAGMLAEMVKFNEWTSQCYWLESYEDVRDTELDYLVRLAEAKLTEEDDQVDYAHNLWIVCGKDDYLLFTATWQQRTVALCQTKGIEA